MKDILVTISLFLFMVLAVLFIFWPEIVNLFKKKPKTEKKSPSLVYRKHYPVEEELLEAKQLADSRTNLYVKMTVQDARELIQERGLKIQQMLENPKEYRHHCPMCEKVNRMQFNEVNIGCQCNNWAFRTKVQEMFKELGYHIW